MTPFRPVHVEAERAALGCALLDENAARELSKSPERFFSRKQHRAVFNAISTLVAGDEPVILASVCERLKKAGAWSDNGDEGKVSTELLIDLTNKAVPPAQLKAYVRMLGNAARQRSILEACDRVSKQACERFLDREELAALQESFQQAAFQLVVSDPEQKAPQPVSALLSQLVTDLDTRAQRRNRPTGIMSAFSKLDLYTTGFHPGELIIVCARPGHGKTAIALDVALNTAAQGTPVLLFSLEMSAGQIGQRLAAKLGSINLRSIRGATLQDHEFSQLVTVLGDTEGLQLYVDDSAALSPMQVRSRARELAIRIGRPLGLIVVDYLQLMSPSKRYDSREREVASISREMKLNAKVLNCPILLLSQLNSQVESRADKRPMLSDLRESGAIEQDADCVIGLHLPFNYSNDDQDRNKAEAILLKQRNGPVGMVPLFWQPETATFHDPM